MRASGLPRALGWCCYQPGQHRQFGREPARCSLATSSRFAAATFVSCPPDRNGFVHAWRHGPMNAWMRFALAATLMGCASSAFAQSPTEPPSSAFPSAPAPTVIAATVNGQEIQELAVFRGLLNRPPEKWKTARKEVLDYLIDNLLVDQYLSQLKIPVEPKDVDERFKQIQDEAVKLGQDFQEILKKLHITEAEMRKELHAALRWDNFVLQQAKDEVLRAFFEKNPAMFDGSQTLARHILVSAKDDAEGQFKIASLKKGIEDEVGKEVSKLPASADKLTV